MKTSTTFSVIIILVAVCLVWFLMSRTNMVPENPIVTDYQNVTYIIEGEPVTLRSDDKVAQYFGNDATGDLNGDGTSDVAFLLTRSGAGSGTFYYVVAAIKTIDGYLGTNAIFLGDRIAPQTTEIKDGQIIVNYADRAVGEPMTASPSVGVSKYLKIDGTTLIEFTK